MSQLSSTQIAATIQEINATQYVRERKSHSWVDEDGAYDDQHNLLRMFVWNGFCYKCASKMWVEDQEANKRLPEWMQVPWGTYPDLPPKPAKKK